MNKLSKICDGADWFDPEFQKVLNEELQEPARFHRKQWEFVTIFLTLQKYGMLKADKLGLSLGGGNEAPLLLSFLSSQALYLHKVFLLYV